MFYCPFKSYLTFTLGIRVRLWTNESSSTLVRRRSGYGIRGAIPCETNVRVLYTAIFWTMDHGPSLIFYCVSKIFGRTDSGEFWTMFGEKETTTTTSQRRCCCCLVVVASTTGHSNKPDSHGLEVFSRRSITTIHVFLHTWRNLVVVRDEISLDTTHMFRHPTLE